MDGVCDIKRRNIFFKLAKTQLKLFYFWPSQLQNSIGNNKWGTFWPNGNQVFICYWTGDKCVIAFPHSLYAYILRLRFLCLLPIFQRKLHFPVVRLVFVMLFSLWIRSIKMKICYLQCKAVSLQFAHISRDMFLDFNNDTYKYWNLKYL